ncbi:hypothetical protein V6N11_067669 [Hibiscus sabdariffa]|uniref:Uncharacterized protein n=1 Tax=Hibiscus sabdariffa TaxID=183260 RepID=A0ABR2SSE8_9ROSI
MKLLGWMHRRRNSSEPLKDFTIGHSCNCLTGESSLDDQQFYSKLKHGTTPFKPSQRDHLRKSFSGVEAAQVDEEDYEVDSSSAMSEIFHGFLASGTLGSDPNILDPSTPTFAISVEKITEKETEVIENELKLINDELEKVLVAEDKEGCNGSSGRNSSVSTERSSHSSTIAFSGKPIEAPDTNRSGITVCSLQGYLLGSAIELSEITTVDKKEHGTTLGELFQRTKITEDNLCSKIDKLTKKEGDKTAVHIMKKKMSNASRSSTAAATGGNIDSASAETKLHKISHMFHKKVDPQNSTTTNKHGKPQENENKDGIFYDGHMLADDDIIIYPQRALSNNIRHYKSQSNPPQFVLSCNDSNGDRECWIKTDAECK